MDKFSNNILKVSAVICSNIEKKEAIADDGLIAQNVVAQLRNFVEAIAIKIYSEEHLVDFNQEGTKQAIKFIKKQDDLVFLQQFHRRLEITDSHITADPEMAQRLMWRYYEYLIECKEYVKEKFDLDVLDSIDDFPFEEDETLKEYYQNIAVEIDKKSKVEITESPTNRFKIIKKKPFRVNGKKYYEITMCEADNKVSKFDRIIAFSQLNIPTFYSVHLKLSNSAISIIGKEMKIKIIIGFRVSTRPCEFNNFFRLFGYSTNTKTDDADYRALMGYLTHTGRNLTDFLDFDDEDFEKTRNHICKDLKRTPIFDGLAKCRQFYGKPGYNVLKYLLYRLNNGVLYVQFDVRPNNLLSNLFIKYKCIPFDTMPFANNPVGYNASLFDLYDCFSIAGREHELLGRTIKTNTENKGQLYTPIAELTRFENLENLINLYNSNLYYKHRTDSSLKLENGQVFITGYENNTVAIIRSLKELSSSGINGYKDSVNDWLEKSAYVIDDEKKKVALPELFENSKVSLIYGSAGTGKSMMIKHISNFFRDKNKIYLANTHAAVENLKRNIGKSDGTRYSTIKNFLYKEKDKDCDILFVDECSTISNEDMALLLYNTNFKLLVLAGDIYQIESIKFGNWFYIAKNCIKTEAILELDYVHRSTEQSLLSLWKSVRELNDNMADIMDINHFCVSMGESIFEKVNDDEIVLCLNYDGLYGINNLNSFLQDNTKGKNIEIGIEQYKVGDPIIFKDNNRFSNYLYNNLKGNIVDINEDARGVKFTLEIDTVFNELDVENAPFQLEKAIHSNKSIISFYVNRFVNKDDDDKADSNIVPFQVAYAVSIHKAQGLEYDSVKIVITDEMEEFISHNIFYTAITRAKKSLQIYWSQRAEQKILDEMHFMFNKKDASILLQKFHLK
jgi:hypothetical protein